MAIISRFINLSLQSLLSESHGLNFFKYGVDDVIRLIVSFLNEHDKISFAMSCKEGLRIVKSLNKERACLLFPKAEITDSIFRLFVIQKKFEEKVRGSTTKSTFSIPFKLAYRNYCFRKLVQGLGKEAFLSYSSNPRGIRSYGIYHINLTSNKWTKTIKCLKYIHFLFFSKKHSEIVFTQNNTIHFFPRNLNDQIDLSINKGTKLGRSRISPYEIQCGDINDNYLFITNKKTVLRINLTTLSEMRVDSTQTHDIDCIHCPKDQDIFLTGSLGEINVWNSELFTLLSNFKLPHVSPSQIQIYQNIMIICQTTNTKVIRWKLDTFTNTSNPIPIAEEWKLAPSFSSIRQTFLYHHILFTITSNSILAFNVLTKECITTIPTKFSTVDFCVTGNSLYRLNGWKLFEYSFGHKKS